MAFKGTRGEKGEGGKNANETKMFFSLSLSEKLPLEALKAKKKPQQKRPQRTCSGDCAERDEERDEELHVVCGGWGVGGGVSFFLLFEVFVFSKKKEKEKKLW